jgi:hypothetical protein
MKLIRLLKYILLCCYTCGWAGLFYGCAQTPDGASSDSRFQPTVIVNGVVFQTPAQEYAGEVLAYLVPLTLGKTGNLKLRGEWSERGLKLPLDYRAISEMMQGPGKDPRRVMVLDNNILGLSQVLYHYDERLNLFKGEGIHRSIFPSTELVSTRVMLLQKMNRGEKIGLAELMEKREQLLNPSIRVEEIDLEGTHLHFSEMKLLKDVIQSEPSFLAYLNHPFIVEMLYKIGAVFMDSYVEEKIQAARYRVLGAEQGRERSGEKSVKVAVLPSIVQSFTYRNIDTDAYPTGFAPEDTYVEAIETFQDTMIRFLKKLVMAQMFGDTVTGDAEEEKRRHAQVEEFIEMHLNLRFMNQRPFVIHPENAEKVIQDVCHDSDFNVIVLGKNVYLSMQVLDVDTFPHVNRLYLDMSDIKHGQVDFEIGQISMFVFEKLKPLIRSSNNLSSSVTK